MELLMNKSMEDLMAISMERLARSPINEVSRGGIARLFLAVINENLAGFYETLKVNHLQAFLSTATGESLDAIGMMVNCTRRVDILESDSDYRLRISKQNLVAEAANETAIRLAAMSIEDVQDVVLRPYALGTGSFSLFLVTENPQTPTETIEAVRSVVAKTAAYGIRFEVAAAGFVPVMMQVKLLFSVNSALGDQQSAKAQVATALRNYLNTRGIGESLVVNEITQRIMEVSDNIVNYQMSSMRVKGKLVMGKDQTCRWNERFCESSTPNAIQVS